MSRSMSEIRKRSLQDACPCELHTQHTLFTNFTTPDAVYLEAKSSIDILNVGILVGYHYRFLFKVYADYFAV